MSQQALNMQRSMQIVRRRWKLFGAIVALGLLIGAAYAVLKPPMPTSTALVVLPQAAAAQSAQAAASGTGDTTGTDTFIATQAVVASSDAVLAGALPHVSPAMSLQALSGKVQVKSLAGSILSISASGGTAAQAEATANAVANSYVAYVSTANSPAGHVPAKVLEPATSATGSKLPGRIILFGLLGALAGALVGFVVSLAIGRNDRRLTERDAIANSIGAPVLASIPVGHPSDAAAWAKLLEGYEPGVVHAWALRRMLQQFGVADVEVGNGARAGGGSSLTVLSLSSDPRAVALGPQLAAFAASLGIPTALVIGPQQDVNAAATLRTACAVPSQSAEGHQKPLQLIVSDDGRLDRLRVAFVVVVAVVDAREPRMPDTIRTTSTVLGVSAGRATAEQLARAATAAAADGREVVGILVADPEPGDQTTGRIPLLTPPIRRRLPTRTEYVPMEIRR
jgi:capsular polysaccharide biosynthesis protein